MPPAQTAITVASNSTSGVSKTRRSVRKRPAKIVKIIIASGLGDGELMFPARKLPLAEIEIGRLQPVEDRVLDRLRPPPPDVLEGPVSDASATGDRLQRTIVVRGALGLDHVVDHRLRAGDSHGAHRLPQIVARSSRETQVNSLT